MKHASFFFILAVAIAFMSCGKTDDSDLMNKAAKEAEAKNFSEALRLYQQVVDEFPESPRAPEAMFRIANINVNDEKKPLQAIAILETLAEKYPQSEYGHKALFIAGFTCANELNNLPKAKALYEKYLAQYPDSSMAATAEFELTHLGKSPEELLNSLQNPVPEQVATGETKEKGK